MKVGSLMTDLEKGRARMKRGLPGVKAPGEGARDRRPQQQRHAALTKDLKTLSVAGRGRRGPGARPTGRPRSVDDVGGQRVFVLWRSYGKRSARASAARSIAHELVHAALARRTGGRVPPWLSEGIAMYVSGDKRAGDAGALLSGAASSRTRPSRSAAKNALSLARLSKPRCAGQHVARSR